MIMLLFLAQLVCVVFSHGRFGLKNKPRPVNASDCTFKVGGKTYDLGPLAGITSTAADSKISTYTYPISVCSDIKDSCHDVMLGKDIYGSIYQYGGEPGGAIVCWTVIAKWHSPVAGPLSPSAGSSEGFSLSFNNGDTCRGSPKRAVVNMICDPANEIGKISGRQDDSDSCLFNFNYPTKHACVGGGPWGINGTFTGNMTCISPDCNINPDSITVKGDCNNMMAVVREDNAMIIYTFKFEECGGYAGRGTLKPQDGTDDDVLSFTLNVHLDGTVWILVNQKDFPFELLAWVELKKA